MSSNKPRLCFIGFGEAGQAIASGLREAGVEQIAAWDILFPEDRGAALKQAGEKIGARLASSAADAVANSDIIVSAVTAGSSIDAARSVAPHLSGTDVRSSVLIRGATAIDRQVQGGSSNAPRLDHLIPARDSQGNQPTRFEWTAVPQADSYSIGVWNEVDMLIWRKDHIPTNSFVPIDLRLDPGTYFWTISALRAGEEITTSGLAAFVVRPSNP